MWKAHGVFRPSPSGARRPQSKTSPPARAAETGDCGGLALKRLQEAEPQTSRPSACSFKSLLSFPNKCSWKRAASQEARALVVQQALPQGRAWWDPNLLPLLSGWLGWGLGADTHPSPPPPGQQRLSEDALSTPVVRGWVPQRGPAHTGQSPSLPKASAGSPAAPQSGDHRKDDRHSQVRMGNNMFKKYWSMAIFDRRAGVLVAINLHGNLKPELEQRLVPKHNKKNL